MGTRAIPHQDSHVHNGANAPLVSSTSNLTSPAHPTTGHVTRRNNSKDGCHSAAVLVGGHFPESSPTPVAPNPPAPVQHQQGKRQTPSRPRQPPGDPLRRRWQTHVDALFANKPSPKLSLTPFTDPYRPAQHNNGRADSGYRYIHVAAIVHRSTPPQSRRSGQN